jgi:hypothetical protein
MTFSKPTSFLIRLTASARKCDIDQLPRQPQMSITKLR